MEKQKKFDYYYDYMNKEDKKKEFEDFRVQ
jgi:hypothetical protein